MLHTPFLRSLQLIEKKVQVLLDTEAALTANSPPCFRLVAKPSGATCNIDCKYCFFLSAAAGVAPHTPGNRTPPYAREGNSK
jgi:hypothetical protein